MNRVLLLLAAFLSILLVSACGSGGEDEAPPPSLPDPTPVPALEGTWCGPGEDRQGNLGGLCITLDAEGNVERLSLDNQSNGAVGTVQETTETDIYTFVMSDGTYGWLCLSESGEHLLYLDGFRTLASLDKSSSSLPTGYFLPDIRDTWIGRSLYLDASAAIVGSDLSGITVGIGDTFTGQDGATPIANQPGRAIVVDNAQFGRYRGRFQLLDGTQGDLALLMAADKDFVVGTLCVDGGIFAQDCSIVFWERAAP